MGAFGIVASLAPAANLGADPARATRVTVARGLAPDTRATAALERLAAAAERGDRAGFLNELAPSTRAKAAPVADALVSTVTRPRTDVLVEVVGLHADGAAGHALVTARVPAEGPAPVTAPGWTRPDPARTTVALAFRLVSEDERRWLALAREHPADAVDAVLVLRLERAGAEWRASGSTRLGLTARSSGVTVACLTLPAGAMARSLDPGVSLSALGAADEPLVRVELSSTLPRDSVTWLALEHDGPVGSSLVKGSSLFFVTAAHAGPWAGSARHRFDVTVDAPEPLRAVSIGAREDLPAEPGRTRSRHDCRRQVDLTAVVVGPYSVHRDGELELWRTRDVGGDPAAILQELRTLVDFQAARVAPLPYGAFRLVELPVTEGLAMSFPSFILMTPGLLATRRERFDILSHEVAHQWWGNAVEGDASTRWISEGMAEAMRDVTLRELVGEAEFHARLKDHRTKSLAGLGASARPLADERGGGLAYDRGALAVHALREAVGEDAFWRILRAWYEELAGRRAGSDEIQSVAERVAGRRLDGVFDPWLRATALPVLEMSWTAKEEHGAFALSVTLDQDDPAFELRVPIRVRTATGTRDLDVRTSRAHETHAFAFDVRPEEVLLDPDGLVPRVHEDELRSYLSREAAACIARGERRRGIALLERARALAFLDTQETLLLAAALTLEGRAADGRAALDAELALLAGDEARHHALLGVVDALLQAGAPDAAEPLLERLERAVDDGAEVPLRRAGLERLRGRETEARAALELAARRRPRSAVALSALGLPTPAPEDDALPGETRVLPPPAEGADAHLAAAPIVAALGAGRVAVLELSLRRLTVVDADGTARRTEHAPAGAVSLAAVEPGLLVVLEREARRSRLVVLDGSASAASRVIARHARCPPGAAALAAPGGVLHVAFTDESGGGVTWHRFTAPLAHDSAGPDDRDGLLALRLEADARFELVRAAPALSTVTADAVVQRDELGRVSESGGRSWDWSEDETLQVVQLVPTAEGFAALLVGNRSRSPFGADALPTVVLVAVGTTEEKRRELPADVASISMARDGDLALVRRVARPDGGQGARVSLVR